TFGDGRGGFRGRHRRSRTICRLRQLRDRIKQKPPLSDHGEAEVPEVIGRQLRQHPHVNPVIAEGWLVLLKSQPSQEFGYIHWPCPDGFSQLQHGPVAAARPVGSRVRGRSRKRASRTSRKWHG